MIEQTTGMPLEESKRIFTKVSRHLMPCLLLCYAMSFIERINIGYAKLQMQKALGFSDAVYGSAASMFFVGFLLFAVPSNLLMARVGARRTLAVLVFGWGIASTSTMLVTTPFQFHVCRFFLGVFEAGMLPGIVFYLTTWYPDLWRGRALSMLLAGTSAAGIVTGPLSGSIMQRMDGLLHYQGWQWLFLVEGVPSALLGVAAFFILADHPAQVSWLTKQEKDWLKRALAPQVASVAVEKVSIRGQPMVYLLSGALFLLNCGTYLLYFWMPTLIQKFGVTDVLWVGLYSAVPYIACTIGILVIGAHSDRTQERRWHFACCAIAATVGFALATVPWPHPAIAVLMLAIANVGQGAAITVFWALAPSQVSRASSAAAIALINSAGVAAGIFSPAAFGYLAQATGRYEAGLYTMATLVALSGVLVLLFISANSMTPDGKVSLSLGSEACTKKSN